MFWNGLLKWKSFVVVIFCFVLSFFLSYLQPYGQKLHVLEYTGRVFCCWVYLFHSCFARWCDDIRQSSDHPRPFPDGWDTFSRLAGEQCSMSQIRPHRGDAAAGMSRADAPFTRWNSEVQLWWQTRTVHNSIFKCLLYESEHYSDIYYIDDRQHFRARRPRGNLLMYPLVTGRPSPMPIGQIPKSITIHMQV